MGRSVADMEIAYFCLKVASNQIAKSEFSSEFVMKGGLVLMSMLEMSGRFDMRRNTTDIDLHVFNPESWLRFKNRIVDILNSNGFGVYYRDFNFKNRSATSDSIQFVADYNGVSAKLKIDMNVSGGNTIGIVFNSMLGVSCYDIVTSLSDKVKVACSRKIFRRIKDMYDICVLSRFGYISSSDILARMRVKSPEFLSNREFMFTSENIEMLRHAYEKYDGIVEKPDFMLVYDMCSTFVEPLYNLKEGLVYNGRYWS